MKASTKRVLTILTAFLLFAGSLVVYSYLIRPVYSEIKNLRAKVAGRLNLINEYEALLNEVQQLLSEYQNIAQLKESVSLMLPAEQNLPQAVNQITSIVKVSGVKINSLAVQQLAIKPSTQPALVKGIGSIRLTIRLTGAYEAFRFFLSALETNITLMDLINLKIEPTTKAEGFSYIMTVDTYYQAE